MSVSRSNRCISPSPSSADVLSQRFRSLGSSLLTPLILVTIGKPGVGRLGASQHTGVPAQPQFPNRFIWILV
ncbi:hypothetical protein THIARS_60613 [Thiomonas delicata]|uniref:Uncharacterized protein n=1 Tax=Thiomonas delicata TaxID=364030 RepID=A0A238D3Z8_THIDL|nr:hypothetical protein THIARS_60613 [Thiomonas delicata]